MLANASQTRLVPLGDAGYPVVVNPQPDSNGIYWGTLTNGFQLEYPDGSIDLFGLSFYPGLEPPGDTSAEALLTERIDPQGRVTVLGYANINFTNYCSSVPPWIINQSIQFQLKYVVDPDGRTNTFVYNTTNSSNPWNIKEIIDPFGRTVKFGYSACDTTWLTSITDANGMTNSFSTQATQTAGFPSMITPYGTTAFYYGEHTDPTYTSNYQMRVTYVTEPTGASQCFAYYQNGSGLIASTGTSPSVPGGWIFDNGSTGDAIDPLYLRNSLYWGRKQTAQYPSNIVLDLTANNGTGPWVAITDMTSNQLQLARLRHWLVGTDGISVTETLSSEQDPSPNNNGALIGARTWSAYGNSTNTADVVSTPQIGAIAQILPDGTTSYTRFGYYSSGLVRSNVQSYSLPGGGVGEFTNRFTYAANSVDLTAITNSMGQYTMIAYNGNHQPTNITDSLGDVTGLAWNGADQNYTLDAVSYPNGQTLNFSYYPPVALPYYPLTNTSGLLAWMSIQPDNVTNFYVNYETGICRL